MKSEISSYTPDVLLDYVLSHLKLKNYTALAHRLRFTYAYISRIRNGKVPVTASLLISIQEETGLSIRELRLLCGDCREQSVEGSVSERKTVSFQEYERMQRELAKVTTERDILRKAMSTLQTTSSEIQPKVQAPDDIDNTRDVPPTRRIVPLFM